MGRKRTYRKPEESPQGFQVDSNTSKIHASFLWDVILNLLLYLLNGSLNETASV